MRYITALPVFNEAPYVDSVLDRVLEKSEDVLVINDGSTDHTGEILDQRDDIRVVNHAVNKGYGAALITAFNYAVEHDYDVLVTIDCDGQHEPQRIPDFVEHCVKTGADIVSGSRYLSQFEGDSRPPEVRQRINQQITAELNERLGLKLTDAFCGFKAYRVSGLRCLDLTEPGYAMPLELWVQAAHGNMKVVELPVPLIYLDEDRSFGGALDDSTTRLKYYRMVLNKSIAAQKQLGSAKVLGECSG